MASAVQKVTLTSSRDIPFSELTLSQSNVRRIVAGLSIEDLAEDIARRTLLQSLSVRPILDAESNETGMFEVQAGGRRYRALELLVKQKRMSKTQLVPCIVQTRGLAEEDSLAENLHRENLHPLDQFRAFQTLREKGLSEEDIAARFFVSTTVVKQRLKLAAVSPKLLDVYVADRMTLDQLMAFTVTNDHAHQETVWDQVSHTRGCTDEPYNIRRKLTEGAVRATDRRAIFVGVDAYEVAGGAVTRDLFEPDGGGWLQDPALLDRLVIERLKAEAEQVQAEGWKWIAVAADFPYGHTAGMRHLHGWIVELTEEETAARKALEVELDGLEQQYAEADDVPEEADRRFEEIETALAAFDDRPVVYDPTEVGSAGAFVSIDRDGTLRIERGYVRPEDEPRTEPAESKEQEGAEAHRYPGSATGGSQHGVIAIGAAGASPPETEAEEEDGIRPLSERLISELTAFRTLALRDAVANNPHVALTALLHKLCIDVFHQHAFENCLEATVHEVSCHIQPADLDKSAPAKAVGARHKAWLAELPRTDAAMWEWLDALSSARRLELLAHCVSFGVNAFYDKNDRCGPYGVKRRIAHADRIARAVDLNMVYYGWFPTVDNYLGRVPKARILDAVREAKGDASAQLIDHLKKPDMAKEAERLLAKSGWLPEPLRTPDMQAEKAECESDGEDLPAFLDEEDDEEPQEIAAE
jgi:ParB family transcriptional regulator, chromosome partitioning protein